MEEGSGVAGEDVGAVCESAFVEDVDAIAGLTRSICDGDAVCAFAADVAADWTLSATAAPFVVACPAAVASPVTPFTEVALTVVELVSLVRSPRCDSESALTSGSLAEPDATAAAALLAFNGMSLALPPPMPASPESLAPSGLPAALAPPGLLATLVLGLPACLSTPAVAAGVAPLALGVEPLASVALPAVADVDWFVSAVSRKPALSGAVWEI